MASERERLDGLLEQVGNRLNSINRMALGPDMMNLYFAVAGLYEYILLLNRLKISIGQICSHDDSVGGA